MLTNLGKIDHKDVTENKKLLAFNISHVGAEEFFAQVSVTHTLEIV